MRNTSALVAAISPDRILSPVPIEISRAATEHEFVATLMGAADTAIEEAVESAEPVESLKDRLQVSSEELAGAFTDDGGQPRLLPA
jgi:hypothetical protein